MTQGYKWNKTWRIKHPDRFRDSKRVDNNRYRHKYPERNRASQKITKLVHRGILKRGPCIICGTNLHIQAHPMDYYDLSKGILWFCDHHNKEYHKMLKSINA